MDEAVGSVLAHTLRLEDGSILRKGVRLAAEDVERIRASGLESVVVAVLDPGDVDENRAAEAVASSLAGPGLRVEHPGAGRANLAAEHDGLLAMDPARIQRFNRASESIQIATLAPLSRVSAGALVATVKVLPFAVTDRELHERCGWIEAERGSMRLRAFRPLSYGLVLTRTPDLGERAARLARERIVGRVVALGGSVSHVVECPHDPAAVAAALADADGRGLDLCLVYGGAATVDMEDVIPTAVRSAYGRIQRFGMPTDPGNFLILADLPRTPLIGVPGCARSPAPSGFDRVLELFAAGLPPGPDDVADLGVGGLLREGAGRPSPRRSTPAHPRIAAVVLAAGSSRRMGPSNKLLAEVEGESMVRRVVRTAGEAGLSPVVVVTRPDDAEVAEALRGLDVRTVSNALADGGMSTSLRAGIEALGPEVSGTFVLLGDMPWVTPDHIQRLVSAFDPSEGREVCVPVHGRRRGNPVLWGRRLFPDILGLTGDRGARTLLDTHSDVVAEVEVEDEGVLRDVDTPGDLG
jgi:molybdenum cofactor cytidylyltransferase